MTTQLSFIVFFFFHFQRSRLSYFVQAVVSHQEHDVRRKKIKPIKNHKTVEPNACTSVHGQKCDFFPQTIHTRELCTVGAVF